MSRESPLPEGVARPTAPYSSVVVDGDLVYTAGQVGFDAEGKLVPGGIEEQFICRHGDAFRLKRRVTLTRSFPSPSPDFHPAKRCVVRHRGEGGC